jgi:hypothetical protein
LLSRGAALHRRRRRDGDRRAVVPLTRMPDSQGFAHTIRRSKATSARVPCRARDGLAPIGAAFDTSIRGS